MISQRVIINNLILNKFKSSVESRFHHEKKSMESGRNEYTDIEDMIESETDLVSLANIKVAIISINIFLL